jgi:hypothetical protein
MKIVSKILFYISVTLFLVGIGMCLFSCKTTKPSPVEQWETTSSITQTIRDTTIKILPDSSFFRANLKVNQGTITIDHITQTKPGRKLAAPKVSIKNNALFVDCQAASERAVLHYINTHQVDSNVRTIPFKVNELTAFQKFQIAGFQLLLMGLLFLLAISYLKSKI